MGPFRIDRLVDFLWSTELVVLILWLGLAALTVTLLVLMRTRWGQARPLRKCMVLSLLAHLLLIGYATTVQIVTYNPLETEEPVIHVSLATADVEPPRAVDRSAAEKKPWETFASDTVAQPSPQEADRAEPADVPEVQRQTQAEPKGLLPNAPLDRMPLAEAVRPEPEMPAADAGGSSTQTAKPAEPIDAPTAERREPAADRSAILPDVERRAEDGIRSLEPVRQSRSGLPSALLEQDLPAPTMDEPATTPDPSDALASATESLLPPSSGSTHEARVPADATSIARPPTAAARPDAESPTAVERLSPWAEQLKPPSIAMRGSTAAAGMAEGAANPTELAVIGTALLPSPRRVRVDQAMPDVYRLRVAPDRSRLAQHMGATAATEQAVRDALNWLADNQDRDGRWNARAHGAGREFNVAGRDRQAAGIHADTGMTGLALLAFLASGHTHSDGIYSANVRRGLEYLIGQQARDGGLGGRATTFAYMYCHAMATFALSEAYGMTGDTNLIGPVRRAVLFTQARQNRTSGGWRYYPGDPGDTSQLGWQVMALKSAELAGIPIPDDARQGAVRFLESVSFGQYGGLAAYRPDEKVTRPMTAEALACRQFLGLSPDHTAASEAGDYLLGELPGEGQKNLYYWYYGTLAMYQLQGVHWKRWNRALQETLLDSQQKSGPLAGSWDPDTVWGGYGGRVYSTALATMCLEVYYRFLPLYEEVPTLTRLPR